MPYTLDETEEEKIEALALESERLYRKGEINQELDLFRHPAWKFMLKRLHDMETGAMEAMLNPENVNLEALRERVRIARNLSNLENQLLEERARLETEE